MISGVFTTTVILRDPGAAIWEDRMFVVKVYSKLSVNFHHEPILSSRPAAAGSPRVMGDRYRGCCLCE